MNNKTISRLIITFFALSFVTVYAQVANPASILAQPPQAGASANIFTKKLQLGTVDAQVTALQQFLKQFPAIYPEGSVTGSFDLPTENAVKRFQKVAGIDVVGVVGPITRTALNRLVTVGTTGTGVPALPNTSPAGTTGATGATGSTGTAGATGAVGATGSVGATGERGAMGIAGIPGTRGSGATGATGATGETGTAGATGNTGAAGAAGSTGATGAVGTTGLAGAAGSTGAAGATGATGNVGAAGAAGLAGTTGAQGVQGVIGTTGAVGSTGAAGAQGIQGVVGTTGAQGVIGTTGAVGNAGAAGAQGIQGVVGTTGNTGAVGATGATGEIGVTGSIGAAGAVGATGALGATGAVGATGAAGTPGTVIPAGIELGTADAFARSQILNKMTNSILRLGTWQSDGDATSNTSEGLVIYGNSLTGQALSPGNGSYARVKNNRFGLFTIDSAAPGFTGSGGYYYRVDDSAMFYKDNAATDVFRVTRSNGNMAVKGSVTLSNFTQAGVVGTNSSGLLAVVSGTAGQVPVWDNSTNGFSWAAAPAGAIPSAQYAQLGSQPGSLAAGQAFTFTTAVLTTPGIVAVTTSPPGGTIFTLANIGRYEVNYQMTYPTDGGVVLYLGATVGTMLPLPYTMIGKTPDGQVHGSVIIETTTANSFLSVNAAANAAPIVVPPNTSTTNQSATTVSIKQIQ